jgi:hypothetical protein
LAPVVTWGQDATWQARLQYIEACSCDLFCPCYFNDHASHQGTGAHKCTFNNVVRVANGKYNNTDLTGLKAWLSGDLGADWSTKGQADWLTVHFEPKATKEQKDALVAIFTKLYPVKWNSVEMDSSDIVWQISKDRKTAYAKLANGKGEVKLTRFGGADAEKPAQLFNVRYFAATWNSPFDLYHSEHYFKSGNKSYSLKQANGFVITVEHTSDGKRVVTTTPKKTD